MCSQKFRKKKQPFVPKDKNDQILYIYCYILWFSYVFKVCSKSVSEIRYTCPVTVAGAVIMHKLFDTGTKHLSATDGQFKVFLGPCGWRNSLFKSPSLHSLQSLWQPPKCIVDTAKMRKTLDVFYIYFFGQWFVEIKLKKLSILTCEFVSNFVARYCYKMVATPCSRQSLTLQSDPPSQYKHSPFLPDLHQKMWWKEFLLHIDPTLIGSSKFGHVRVFVNYVLQLNV